MSAVFCDFDFISSLVLAEQDRQGGGFIEGVDVFGYILKIKKRAEIISHCIDGVCAGFVAFYCNDLVFGRSYITLVLVDPCFRGRGIARNLIGLVLVVARSRGFSECCLEVKSENYSAIRLYESLGFSVFSVSDGKSVMRISL